MYTILSANVHMYVFWYTANKRQRYLFHICTYFVFFFTDWCKISFFVLFIAPLSSALLSFVTVHFIYNSKTELNYVLLAEWIVMSCTNREHIVSWANHPRERESVIVCLCSLFVKTKIKARVRNKINNENNRQ